MTRICMTAVVLMLALFVGGSVASADSTPIGPLPPGSHAEVSTRVGGLVAVALPKRTNGLVWRIARSIDGKVVTEVFEGDVGPTVVIVFRAVGRGTTTVVAALTKGDTGSRAYASATEVIRVR